MQYQSLYPEITRTLSIRFDPSYYYEQQKHPTTLAKELAKKWHDNGVNLVFFRAYDPRYGAFYKTRYLYSKTGDYGKYDFLGKVVKECHSRNIKVFSWFPFLNHAGAWKKHPSWRIKTADSMDYSVQGLEFPLSPGNKEVRRWWLGFLSDFLDQYPGIDGVDFGEPVVSWGGKQKVSDFQAASLTRLLGDSVAIVHQKKKKVCITTAQSAFPSGDLFIPDELKKITGFDLSGVLKAEKNRTPDIICPEFIWQELKSRHEPGKDTMVFTPAWTEKAVRQFIKWIESPVEIIIHVELTDFPNVSVNGSQLKNTFRASIRGGAVGLDVYSSHELDKKDAWSVIREARNMALTKSCLVLYDQAGGKNDAIQTGELLRHFNTDVTLIPLDEYKKGTLKRYNAAFYVGTVSGATLPGHFLSDLLKGGRTFCWLGFNIDAALNQPEVSKRLGIQYIGAIKNRYKNVIYKGDNLINQNPWINEVQVVDDDKCSTLAKALYGKTHIPYALRCGQNFWYFADVPSSHAVEGCRFLVFADLLHDILNENHETRHLAMVRIEDVHPLSDPDALRDIASFLHRQHVPFQISLVPFYVFPDQNIYVGLHEKPEFVEAIKYMVEKGGGVVMHGTTHQRFGETTSDYEFWDPLNNRPPEGVNAATIREKLEKGLKECWSVGIYPLMWETPHYAGSQELYRTVKDYFSIAMERRQAIDQAGSDQYLPYLVPCDRFGQTMVPENLGYVPLDRQDPDVILEPARHTKVVRDGVASFFFHPFVKIDVLKTVVKNMKKEGFEFTSIGDLPIRVRTPFGMMTNTSDNVIPAREGYNGYETRGVFPGIMPKPKKVVRNDGDTDHRSVRLESGEMYFVHFMHRVIDTPEVDMASKSEKIENMFFTVPDFYGEHRQVCRPLLIEPLQKHSGIDTEYFQIQPDHLFQ